MRALCSVSDGYYYHTHCAHACTAHIARMEDTPHDTHRRYDETVVAALAVLVAVDANGEFREGGDESEIEVTDRDTEMGETEEWLVRRMEEFRRLAAQRDEPALDWPELGAYDVERDGWGGGSKGGERDLTSRSGW